MSLTRRTVLGAGVAAVTATVAGAQTAATAATAPYEAPLRAVLTKYLKPTAANPQHPTYAGAVAFVMVNNAMTASVAVSARR